MQDEASVKLINLFHYEARRLVPAAWATRLANAAGVCVDEHTIRAVARADGSIALAQLDLDRTEVQAYPGDSDAHEFLAAFLATSEAAVHRKLSSRAPLCSRCCSTWLSQPPCSRCFASCVPPAAHLATSEAVVRLRVKQHGVRAGGAPPLFLRRTLHAAAAAGGSTDARQAHLEECYIRNGLESKLKLCDSAPVRPLLQRPDLIRNTQR